MNHRIGLLTLIASLLLAVACGSSGGGTNKPPPIRTAKPTATSSGPTASINPTTGRPGEDVVVTGAGWGAGSMVTIAPAVPAGSTLPTPYTTVTSGPDGSFTARIQLDKGADGDTLRPGPTNIVASSDSGRVIMLFQVQPPLQIGAGG